MSLREQGAPEFSYSLRGYDRVEVDEYVAWLRDYAIAIEERSAAAELDLAACRTELASPGGSGFSQRLDAILQLANDEAADIRAQAQAAAEAVREEAAADAARTLVEVSDRRDAIQREVDELLTVREDLVQRLAELEAGIRAAHERYAGNPPGSAPTLRVDVELFDGEAIETEGDEALAAVDASSVEEDLPGGDAPQTDTDESDAGEAESGDEALTPSGPAPEG